MAGAGIAVNTGIFIERRFRRPRDRETGQADEDLTWNDFGHEHVIVVLGEPGAGKTTEFEHQAAKEPSSNFLTIRSFLRLPLEDPRLRARTLYLDGLDEMRADGSPHGVLDSVIKRLIDLSRPRARLSCRAADWFGELDRSQLMDAAPSSEVIVVELQPLLKEEIEQLVRAAGLQAPASFLGTVHRQRLDDWLANPQTLELMIDVARKGTLPSTRTELFERACSIMAREENRAHRQAVRASAGINEMLDAAGFLCALELIAGLGGFAADRDESDPDFPPLEDLPFSQDELCAAVSSRLFRWSEGRATPIHRTIAEFLATRTLRDRIRKGLPLARVLRLITGQDGGTLSDLRGLFAWLITLLPEYAALLAVRDPAALILYGDPEPLSPDVKRVISGELEKLMGRERDACAIATFMFVHGLVPPNRTIHKARYQRPSLNSVIKVLQGGVPTNVADLHAVVCDHLRTLAEEIEKGPESGFRKFWNVKSREVLESPVPENEARNRLSTSLNERLRPLGISAEIEGHYTGSKRADLKVIFRSMNVPVEIKRSDHRKFWTAPREQLKAKYSIDPGAGGFGIYLVFWFGADEGKGLPKPPPGVARPSTAAEMEEALRQIYSGEEWRDTEFLCIDCSRRSGNSRL
jgi:hypothetical protein